MSLTRKWLGVERFSIDVSGPGGPSVETVYAAVDAPDGVETVALGPEGRWEPDEPAVYPDDAPADDSRFDSRFEKVGILSDEGPDGEPWVFAVVWADPHAKDWYITDARPARAQR